MDEECDAEMEEMCLDYTIMIEIKNNTTNDQGKTCINVMESMCD